MNVTAVAPSNASMRDWLECAAAYMRQPTEKRRRGRRRRRRGAYQQLAAAAAPRTEVPIGTMRMFVDLSLAGSEGAPDAFSNAKLTLISEAARTTRGMYVREYMSHADVLLFVYDGDSSEQLDLLCTEFIDPYCAPPDSDAYAKLAARAARTKPVRAQLICLVSLNAFEPRLRRAAAWPPLIDAGMVTCKRARDVVHRLRAEYRRRAYFVQVNMNSESAPAEAFARIVYARTSAAAAAAAAGDDDAGTDADSVTHEIALSDDGSGGGGGADEIVVGASPFLTREQAERALQRPAAPRRRWWHALCCGARR